MVITLCVKKNGIGIRLLASQDFIYITRIVNANKYIYGRVDHYRWIKGKSGIFPPDYASFLSGRGRGDIFWADWSVFREGPSRAERMLESAGPDGNRALRAASAKSFKQVELGCVIALQLLKVFGAQPFGLSGKALNVQFFGW